MAARERARALIVLRAHDVNGPALSWLLSLSAQEGLRVWLISPRPLPKVAVEGVVVSRVSPDGASPGVGADHRVGCGSADLNGLVPESHSAARGASRAEIEKTTRRWRGSPPGCGCAARCRAQRWRRRTPRHSSRALRAGGMRVRLRHDEAGRLVGYAVARPGDTTAGGSPVWYGGGQAGPVAVAACESAGLAGEVQDGQRFAVEVAYAGLAAVGYQRNAGWAGPGRDDPV